MHATNQWMQQKRCSRPSTIMRRLAQALQDAAALQREWPDWSKSWFRGACALEASRQHVSALQQYAAAWQLEAGVIACSCIVSCQPGC
jgi:hypothetical protein